MLKSLGLLKGTFTKKPGSSASNTLVSFNFYLKGLPWTNMKWKNMGLPENGIEIPLIWTKQWYHTWIILCLLLHQSGDLISGATFFVDETNLQGCEFSIARWDSKRHTQVPNPLSILHCWRVNPQIVDELLLLLVEPILDPDDHSGFSSPWASYRIISVNFHYTLWWTNIT